MKENARTIIPLEDFETFSPEDAEVLGLLMWAIWEEKKVEGIVSNYGDLIVSVKDETKKAPRYSVVMNQRQIKAQKGAVYGEVLRARHLGLQYEADQILLSEGIPQELTPENSKFLKDFDLKYGI